MGQIGTGELDRLVRTGKLESFEHTGIHVQAHPQRTSLHLFLQPHGDQVIVGFVGPARSPRNPTGCPRAVFADHNPPSAAIDLSQADQCPPGRDLVAKAQISVRHARNRHPAALRPGSIGRCGVSRGRRRDHLGWALRR